MTDKKKLSFPKIHMIYAATESGLVGKGDGLPWVSSFDSKWFQKHTINNPVLFGKNTSLTMGQVGCFPLKNRPCAIVSKTMGQNLISPQGGALVFEDLYSACQHYRNFYNIVIAGGLGLYRTALRTTQPWPDMFGTPEIDNPLVDTVIKTTFPDGYCKGDVYFKDFDPAKDSQFYLAQKETYALCKNDVGKDAYFPEIGYEHVGIFHEDGAREMMPVGGMMTAFEGYTVRETDTPFPWIIFEIWKRRTK